MKKFFTIIILAICAVLSFTLGACGDNQGGGENDGGKTEGALTREEIYAMLPKEVTLTSGVSVTIESTETLFTAGDAWDKYSYYEGNGKTYVEHEWRDSETQNVNYLNYGKIGNEYYEVYTYDNGKVQSVQRTKRNYDGYIAELKDSLEGILDTFEIATNVNAKTSADLLGDDYKVEFSGKRTANGCELSATANFVLNVSLTEPPQSLYNVWYWSGETTAFQMTVNAVTDAQDRCKTFEMKITRLKGYCHESQENDMYDNVKLTFEYGFEKSLTEKDLLNLKKFDEGGKCKILLAGDSDVQFPSDFETVYQRNTTVTLPSLEDKDGLKFAGWYYDSNFEEKIEGGTLLLDGNSVAVYPRWQGKTPVLHLNGGTLVTKVDGGLDGEKLLLNAKTYADLAYVYPLKDGYAFSGWYTEASLENKIDYSSREYLQGEDLYAKYDKVITLTPVAEDLGYKILPQKGRAGYKAYLPEAQTVLGTLFKCWKYTSDDPEGEEWNGRFPDEDRKIYAYLEKGWILTAYNNTYYDENQGKWMYGDEPTYDEKNSNGASFGYSSEVYQITIPRSGSVGDLQEYLEQVEQHFNLTRKNQVMAPASWESGYDRFNYFAGDYWWYFGYFTNEKSKGIMPADYIKQYPEGDITVYATYTPHELYSVNYKIRGVDDVFHVYYDGEDYERKRSIDESTLYMCARQEIENNPEYSEIELLTRISSIDGTRYSGVYKNEDMDDYLSEIIYSENESFFVNEYEKIIRETGNTVVWLNARGRQYVRVHFPDNPDGLKLIEVANNEYFSKDSLPCPLTMYANYYSGGWSAYGNYKNYIPDGKVLFAYYYDEECTQMVPFNSNEENDFSSVVSNAFLNQIESVDIYAKLIDDVQITLKEDESVFVTDTGSNGGNVSVSRRVTEYLGFGYYATGIYRDSTDQGYTTDKFNDVKSKYAVVQNTDGKYEIVSKERFVRDLEKKAWNKETDTDEVAYEDSYEKLTHLRDFPKNENGDYVFTYTWWLQTFATPGSMNPSLNDFLSQMCVYEVVHTYTNDDTSPYIEDYIVSRNLYFTDEEGKEVKLFTVSGGEKVIDDEKIEKSDTEYTFLTGKIELYVNRMPGSNIA